MYLVRKEDNNGMALAGTTSWGEVWSVIETQSGDISGVDALFVGFFVDEVDATSIAHSLRRIAELEAQLAQAIKTGGVPF